LVVDCQSGPRLIAAMLGDLFARYTDAGLAVASVVVMQRDFFTTNETIGDPLQRELWLTASGSDAR
jgi:hypothetical protein